MRRAQVSTAGADTNGLCDIGSVEVPNIQPLQVTDAALLPSPTAECLGSTTGPACTIRQAVRDANTMGGAVITLQPGSTHTLSVAGQNEDATATGDLDVTVGLIVQGPFDLSAGPAIIQAGTTATNGVDRIFDVQPGAELRLRDTVLQFGNLPSADGGAVRAQGPVSALPYFW